MTDSSSDQEKPATPIDEADLAELKERIRQVIERESAVVLADIAPGTTLADADVDSISVVEMLMGLEEEFDVYIPVDGPLSKVKTIDELLDTLALTIHELQAEKDKSDNG